jgi:hypothetical protein
MQLERRDEPLASTWHPWPEHDSRYLVGLHFAEIAGRAELVGVEMWSGRPPLSRFPERDRPFWAKEPPPGSGGPLPAAAIRQPAIGRLAAKARQTNEDMARLIQELGDPQEDSPEVLEAAERTLRLFEAKGASRTAGGRKPDYGPEHYAKVAVVYSAAWRAGEHPTKAVAAWRNVAPSTAAKWVAKTRALGLLPPTTKGKPSAPAAPVRGSRGSDSTDPKEAS